MTVRIRRRLAPGWLALWALLAAVMAAVVVVPPVVLAPTSMSEEPDFIMFVSVYGALWGAFAGAVTGSLVKKLVPRAAGPQEPSRLTRWLSGRWNGELWLAALAGAALAVSPVVAVVLGATWLVAPLGVTALCAVASVVAIVAVRRTGLDEGGGAHSVGPLPEAYGLRCPQERP